MIASSMYDMTIILQYRIDRKINHMLHVSVQLLFQFRCGDVWNDVIRSFTNI